MLDFTVVLENMPSLLRGMWMTTWISLLSIAIGFFIGVVLCLGRMSTKRSICNICAFYISCLRGTPLLVQLVIVFYFLPLIGIQIPSIAAAIIALSMNTAAFQAEILRGGFQVLPKGQREAAWTFGINGWQRLRYIELPQVFRQTLPSLVNETIDIVKNSALISTIAVTDLMRIAQTYSSTTYRPIEFFVTAGLLYLILTSCIGVAGRYIESRLEIH
ncbi:amino acid ABC transporter permease [Vibrio hangzhouensis]|uniref:Polar amino acid transport system permease protein n=1 Tax=Vibrio hangzhouensis TaxID=462991 RepID=A0A1H5RR19_9VIBR|nr:amino acid ABC transporter permease [Vibrio hangzhouensis]SEF40720.1 polar amino acid transport system permease protein [Vibrio hangzhouensis]